MVNEDVTAFQVQRVMPFLETQCWETSLINVNIYQSAARDSTVRRL